MLNTFYNISNNNNNKLWNFFLFVSFFYEKTLTWLFLNQFWLIYIDIKSIQHMLHVDDAQHRDFELRLESIKRSLPLLSFLQHAKFCLKQTYHLQKQIIQVWKINYLKQDYQFMLKIDMHIEHQSRNRYEWITDN